MNANPKWDLCLQLGEEGEALVEELLSGARKIEVKRDFRSAISGNLAIEYKYKGRNSGIAVTEAEWWAIVTECKGESSTVFFIRTDRLKELCRKHFDKRISGGDGGQSRMVLIPICEVLQ